MKQKIEGNASIVRKMRLQCPTCGVYLEPEKAEKFYGLCPNCNTVVSADDKIEEVVND